MLSKVLVPQRQQVLDAIIDGPGDADASPLGQAFHTGSDIDPVSVNPLSFLDHIPKVDPDAKLHPAVFRQLSVSGSELLLDLHGTLDRIHHAGKLSQKVIPRRVHHPTPMLPDDA